MICSRLVEESFWPGIVRSSSMMAHQRWVCVEARSSQLVRQGW